jgi:hypothetical protein
MSSEHPSTSRRRITEQVTRPAAGVAVLVAPLYLAWRLGWSHRGADPPVWAVLLAIETVVLARTVLEAIVLLGPRARGRLAAVPRVPAELVVVVGDEPLALVRMCIRSCRAVPGVVRVRLVDVFARDDVADTCARLGVERFAAVDATSSAAAFDRVLLECGSQVIGLVPASNLVLPGILDAVLPAISVPGVGVATVAAPASSVAGLVGSGGYPLAVDDSARLARGLEAHGVALPLHGPTFFRTTFLHALGGFVAATGRPALATAIALGERGIRTAVVDAPVARRATPWSEDHALRERARLVGSRVATARHRSVGWFPAGRRGWPAVAHLLAALEVWSAVARAAALAVLLVVPLTGWVPLTMGDRGFAVGAVFWTAVACAGRGAFAPDEPVGARLRRGFRTLWVDLRALAGRSTSPRPGAAIRGQLRVVVVMLVCALVAGVSPFVGPAAGRLPEYAHGVLLLGALVVAWLARDGLFAVEDRQRRAMPRAAVRTVQAVRAAGGPEVTHLSPLGVDIVDRAGAPVVGEVAVGEVLQVALRLPVGSERLWERVLDAVVVRVSAEGIAYARFTFEDARCPDGRDEAAFDELSYFCAVTVPLMVDAGVRPAPVAGIRRTGLRRDPGSLRSPLRGAALDERREGDGPLERLGFYTAVTAVGSS